MIALALECSAVSFVRPVIYKQPKGYCVTGPHGSVVLSADAYGYPPLGYVWRKDGQPMGIESTNWLWVHVTNSASYDVVITNRFGSATSSPAWVDVLDGVLPFVIFEQDQAACSRYPAYFTVDHPHGLEHHLTCQWRHNGADLPGATLDYVIVTNVTPADAGVYSLLVRGPGTPVELTAGTLVVDPPVPVIREHPASQVVSAGSPFVLGVRTESCQPQSYQWRSNKVALSGEINPALAFPAARADLTADYSVVVSTTGGSVTSCPAIVVVEEFPPSLTCQPQSQAVSAGDTLRLSVCVSNLGLGSCQWLRDGAPVAGALFNTLTIRDVWTTDAGAYRCAASNRLGAVTSAVAMVTVTASLPVIGVEPQSQTPLAGETLRLWVAGSGAPAPTFQWRRDGADIPGATQTNFTRTNVVPADSGDYVVVLSNVVGLATSRVARVTVAPNPPVIIQPPQDLTVFDGALAHFSVGAGGFQPLSYEWQTGLRNSQEPFERVGTNSADLWLPVAAPGVADYRVIIRNVFGSVTSAMARLTVAPLPPAITNPPQALSVDLGNPAVFSAGVSGSAPFVFEWQRNGLAVPGGTGLSLQLPAVTTNSAGEYRLIASNAGGSATSAPALLTVLVRKPVITKQTGRVNSDIGLDVSFSVEAAGALPLFYQWQFNGQALAGATNPVLRFQAVSTNQAGNYQVVVSNFMGKASSAAAALTLRGYPAGIASSPSSLSADAGSAGTFSGAASGNLPLACWWQRNGQNIAGSLIEHPVVDRPTNAAFLPAALTLPSVSSNDAGSYRFVASNAFGVQTSAPAALTVVYRPPVLLASPASVSAYAGNTVTFTVSAAGGPAPQFQWFCDGRPVPGATGSNYSFAVASASQAGDYRAKASNPLGSVTSAVARLTVIVSAPAFSTLPAGKTLAAGDSLALRAAATGAPGPAYQWHFNGQPIPGATNAIVDSHSSGPVANHSVFAPGATTLGDAGDYSVAAWNSQGAVTSAAVRVSVRPPGALDRWQWRNPAPQGNDLSCAAWGNGLFVAMGQNGARLVSTNNGASWACQNAGRIDTLGLAFGNGLFVAAGSEALEPPDTAVSRIQTSPDGVLWTPQPLAIPPGEILRDVAFGSGRFVAVTDWGAALVSTNGRDWVRVAGAAAGALERIAWGNGLFVAAGRAQSTGAGVTTVSADGVLWHATEWGVVASPQGLAFGNGRFVLCPGGWMAGAVWVSSNGLAWASNSMPAGCAFKCAAFGQGRFVALASDIPGAWTSPDGVDWVCDPASLADPSGRMILETRALAFGGGRFLAAGARGGMAVSTNGAGWTILSPGGSGGLRSAAKGNGLAVAVGEAGLVLTSPDGLAWTRQPAPTAATLRSVVFGGGSFVAVTDSGRALLSADGAGWSAAAPPEGASLHGVTAGPGGFVAVGEEGQIVTSSQGMVWADQTSGTSCPLNAVACDGRVYAAVGRDGTIVTSSDAVHWTLRSSPATNTLQAAACGNGRFVVAGKGGAVLVSADATAWDWAPGAAAVFGATDIEDVQFAHNTFIAVGAAGFAATSTDGLAWTRRRTGCQSGLRASVYAEGRVTLVGENLTVMQSEFFGPPILRARPPRPGEPFGLAVDCEPGTPCGLEASADLVAWAPLPAFSNIPPGAVFFDTNSGRLPKRFYRVTSP